MSASPFAAALQWSARLEDTSWRLSPTITAVSARFEDTLDFVVVAALTHNLVASAVSSTRRPAIVAVTARLEDSIVFLVGVQPNIAAVNGHPEHTAVALLAMAVRGSSHDVDDDEIHWQREAWLDFARALEGWSLVTTSPELRVASHPWVSSELRLCAARWFCNACDRGDVGSVFRGQLERAFNCSSGYAAAIATFLSFRCLSAPSPSAWGVMVRVARSNTAHTRGSRSLPAGSDIGE